MTATEEYTDVLTEELTDELVQAAAAIPIEPEPESASVSSESEPVSEPADREGSANSIDVDIEDMVGEVEDVPGELPEIVTSESSRNDYYDSNERKARGFIMRQGLEIRNNLDIQDSQDSRFMDVLLIDSQGDFHIVYQPVKDTTFRLPTDEVILNSFSFGPALVDNGQLVEDFQGADRWIDMATDQQKQRICLCQAGPLHYKVICCAGPYKGNTGMTVAQMARLAHSQNVQVAYNLDGGDSTMLYFNHAKVNDLGIRTNRKLMDVIYFASAE